MPIETFPSGYTTETNSSGPVTRLFNRVQGCPIETTLQARLFNAVTFCASLLCIFLFVGDLAQEIDFRIALAAGLFNLFLYVLSKRGHYAEWMVWAFVVANYGAIAATWRFTGGLSGPSLPITLTVATVIPMLLSGPRRLIALVLLLSLLTSLYAIELQSPKLLAAYESHRSQLTDMYLTTVLLGALVVLLVSLVLHSHLVQHKRNDSLNKQLKGANASLEEQNHQLQKAMEEIKTLKGIVPICSICKKIRNDEGYYEAVEAYMAKHAGTAFSHTMCPECVARDYPEVQKVKDERRARAEQAAKDRTS